MLRENRSETLNIKIIDQSHWLTGRIVQCLIRINIELIANNISLINIINGSFSVQDFRAIYNIVDKA